MNHSRILLVFMLSLFFTGCASMQETDPAKQNTITRIFAGATGMDARTLSIMQSKLDKLEVQAKSIGEDLVFYQSELYAIKKDMNKFELTEKQLASLNDDIKRLEAEAENLDRQNRRNKEMIAQKESDIESKDTEKDKLENEIASINSNVERVDKQANIVRDGIKNIAKRRLSFSNKD